MNFLEYFAESLSGVVDNKFLMGIYLSAIVFVLRDYWNKFIHKFNYDKKIGLEIIFFIFIIPASLLALTIFITIFWLLSFII